MREKRMGHTFGKRAMAVMLTLCMLLGMVPALAAEAESLPEIDVTVNQAEPTAADAVIATIDALPSMDEWTAMDEAAARAVMSDILAAKEAYDALTDEEKATIDEVPTAKLTELAELAQQLANVMPMAATSGDELDFKATVSQSGTGYVWDNSTLTLTLTDLDYASTDATGISLPAGAKLVLNGTSSLTCSGPKMPPSDRYALYCADALTVSGTGSLVATAGNDGTRCYGVYIQGGDLTINSGSLTGAGANAVTSYGVYVSKNITVNGGALSGIGGQAGQKSLGVAAGKTIVVNEGTLTAKGGVGQTSSCAVEASGLTLGSVASINCNSGTNTDYTDVANFAIKSGTTGNVYEADQTTIAKDVKITVVEAPPIATGTSGTCSWKITAAGVLTIYPTEGSEGTLAPIDGNPPWIRDVGKITSVKIKEGVKANANSSHLFYYLNKCTSIDLANLDTTGVTNMSYMFNFSNSLSTLDLSSFDTTQVTDMSGMFNSCEALESLTFGQNFNTANVEKMPDMFKGCQKLASLDLSTFNTAKVTNMSHMFDTCGALTTLDLSTFDTTQVTNMEYMFYFCSALETIDLSGFHTAEVTTMANMFNFCNKLAALDLSTFDFTKVSSMTNMFYSRTLGLNTDYYKKAMGGTTLYLYEKHSKDDLTTTDLDGTETKVIYQPYTIAKTATTNGSFTTSSRVTPAEYMNYFTKTAGFYPAGTAPSYDGTKSYVQQGETVTITLTPTSGNVLDTLTVMQGSNEITTTPSGSNYTFTMPAGDVTITASFKKPGFPVTFSVTKDGNVWTDHSKTFELSKDGGANFIADLNLVPEGSYIVYEVRDGEKKNTGVTVAVSGGSATAYLKYYTLTIGKTPGIATVSGDGVYFKGEIVALEATAAEGYVFREWRRLDGFSNVFVASPLTVDGVCLITATALPVSTSNQNYTVTINGTSQNYAYFMDAWDAATGDDNTAGATVQLHSDVTHANHFVATDGPITVPMGKTVTLDLNGHAIDRGLKAPVDFGGSVITVESDKGENRGKLTLDDTSETKTGKITGGYSEGAGGGIVVAGDFIMLGGTITGNTALMGGGVAIGTGTTELKGGAITGNKVNKLDNDSICYGGGLQVSVIEAAMFGLPLPIVKLSGGITITGNTDADGNPSNVALELLPQGAMGQNTPAADTSSVLTVAGKLTGTIGVWIMEYSMVDFSPVLTPTTGTAAIADAAYNSGVLQASDIACFTSDNADFAARPAVDNKSLLLIDADDAAVADAKAAVVDGSVNVAFGADQAAITTAVQTYVDGLLAAVSGAAGVTAIVTYSSGNDYSVALSKGSASDSKTISMTVTEAPDPDIAIIAVAKTAVEGATYTATTQAATADENAASDYVKGIAETAVSNGDVTVTVTKVSYIAPSTGVFANLDGTDGSYVFTVTVSKGIQSEITTQLTLTITATPCAKITVSFDSKGAEGGNPESIEVYPGGPYGTLPAPSKGGFSFTGWYTAATGGNLVTAETTVAPGATDHTLYARWGLTNPIVSLTANTTSATYTGSTVITLTAGATHSASNPTFTYEWYKGDDKLDDETASTLALTNVSDSGRYSVKVRATADGLTSPWVESGAANPIINKATPTVSTVPTATAISYGQALSGSTLSGGVANTEGTFTWTNGAVKPAVADSGETAYDVTFTPTDTANYNTASCNVKVTVNKVTLTVGATANNKTYDGTPTATGTVSLTGAVNGEVPTATGTFAFADGNAADGTTVNVTGITLPENWGYNYVLNADTTTATATIAPLAAVLTWSGTALTYTAAEQTVTASVSNKIGSDTFALTYTDYAKTDAGTYTAAVTALGNANYTLTGATGVTQAWAIAKAPASFVISNNSYNYDGTAKTATVAQTQGETPAIGAGFTVAYQQSGQTVASPIKAGEYDVVVTLTSDNFKHKDKAEDARAITVGTLTIQGVTPTITTSPTAAAITYGQTLASSTLTGGVASVEGAFAWSDDTQKPTVSDSEKTAYDVTFTPTDGNYSAVTLTVTLPVTPKGLIITGAAAQTRAYVRGNTAVVMTGGSLVGLVEGDAVTLNASGAVGSLESDTAGENKAVTVFGYALAGVDAGNYTLAQPTGITVTITPRDLSAEGIAVDAIADQPYQGGTAVTPLPVVKDGGTALVSDTDYTLAYTANTAPGTATVTATGKGNYTGEIAKTFSIVLGSAPAGSFTTPGGLGEWVKTPVVVTGSTGYEVSEDFDSGFGPTLTLNTEGPQTVPIYVKNTESGAVTQGSVTYKLDTVAPELESLTGIPNDWFTSAKATFVATDALSGVKTVTVTCSDNKPVIRDGDSFTVDRNGDYTITITDNAGNTNAALFTVEKVDTIAPTASIAPIPDSTKWYGETTITVTATDETSAVKEYSFDGGASWQSGNTKTFGSGEHTVTVWVKDNAGNIVKLDAVTLKVDTAIDGFVTAVGALTGSSTLDDLLAALTDYAANAHIAASDAGQTAYETLAGYLAGKYDGIVAEINAILEKTPPTRTEIGTADSLYDLLDATNQAKVDKTKLDKLVADKEAAAGFVAALIPAPTTWDALKELVEDYAALSDEAKVLLTPEEQAAYDALKAKHDAVKDFIDAVEAITKPYTDATKDKITDAQDKLAAAEAAGADSFIPAPDKDKYEDAKDALDKAQAVEDKITALPEHIPGTDCTTNGNDYDTHKTSIEQAKLAYEKLTQAERDLIDSETAQKLGGQYNALMKYLNYVSKKDDVEVVGLAENVKTDNITTEPGDKLTIELSVEKKTPTDESAKTALDTAKGAAQTANPKAVQAGSYDVKLLAKVNNVFADYAQPDTGKSVVVRIKLADTFRLDTLTIYHIKDGNTTPATVAHQVITEGGASYAVFETDSFSYFVLFAEKETTQPPVNPDSSGGGSSSTTTKPEIVKPEHGGVSVTPENAKPGDKVDVSAKPDEGYVVDKITVTDKNGKEVPVKDNGDGTYTFTQPSGKVTIAVTFKAEGQGLPFTDVKAGDWFYESVAAVYGQGLMTGTSGTTFSPYLSTDRGMIVTILWRMENSPKASKPLAFPDVTAGQYYTDAVAWGAEQGIIMGYDDRRYAPGDPITREQLAAILWRYAKHKGMDVSMGESTNLLSYPDFAQISTYAIPALQWACGAGVMNGKNGVMLDPTGTATRAETAAMLERFLKIIVE